MSNEQQFNEEVLQALHNIAAELKRLNQTLATSNTAAPASRPPMGRPVGRPAGPGRPPGRPSTNRSSYSKEGSYSRSSESSSFGKEGGFNKEGGAPSRFPKKAGSFGKGKPPVKKGDGYPKKAR